MKLNSRAVHFADVSVRIDNGTMRLMEGLKKQGRKPAERIKIHANTRSVIWSERLQRAI